MAISSPEAGDHILDLIKERTRCLAVPAPNRHEAEEMVRTRGVTGMDEKKLLSEWLSDVLAGGAEAFEEARRDPGAAYIAWLEARVGDPYHVSFRAVRAVASKLGQEQANAFVHMRWRQEIAWAKRLRASQDPRVAVFSHSFLLAVAKDPSKWFVDLAQAWDSVLSEPGFAQRPEHQLDESVIRHGRGGTDYVPVFLRVFNARQADLIDRMPQAQLAAAAARARRTEEQEISQIAAGYAVAAARRTPLARMIGVIDVALETGRGSDSLVADESVFLDELLAGKIALASRGLPYSEFIAWLRAGPAPSDPAPPEPGSASHQTVALLRLKPQSWLSALPQDFVELGGDERDSFHAWFTALDRGERPVPHDLVVDYGFHLVRTRLRRKVVA